MKIVNHASPCYVQSCLTPLIWALSRITLIIWVPSRVTENPFATLITSNVFHCISLWFSLSDKEEWRVCQLWIKNLNMFQLMILVTGKNNYLKEFLHCYRSKAALNSRGHCCYCSVLCLNHYFSAVTHTLNSPVELWRRYQTNQKALTIRVYMQKYGSALCQSRKGIKDGGWQKQKWPFSRIITIISSWLRQTKWSAFIAIWMTQPQFSLVCP